MNRILIVSNRLPVTIKVEGDGFQIQASSGGLATALKGPHEQSDSLWIGWPGDFARLPAESHTAINAALLERRCVPVHLTQGEINRFYEGFSNGVLWPLYHYLIDKIDRHAWTNWKTFLEVNERFAEEIVPHYRPGDIIWVQDYQLSLLPALLRKRLPRARIGFFLHIPFPSSEVFRILPWREEILQGMLGADVIGFHTYSYLRHFRKALLHSLGTDDACIDQTTVTVGNRTVRLGVFPIGIDVGHFEEAAESADVLAEVEAIRAAHPNCRIVLGIDRLDYTKGLVRRMLAIERFLEREPQYREEVRFIQVAVPSRTKVESYAQLRRELDEIVGRINALHGTPTSMPLHYLYRALGEKQLIGLYRAADVMLVTPLRDGMNLVAKEYVATRLDDSGVLILSEFAGAAADLAEALIVNPYDVDRLATVIQRALTMPLSEQHERMRTLRQRVRVFNAFHWVKMNLEALQKVQPAAEDGAIEPLSAGGQQELLDRIRNHPTCQLLLDYDGTLVPFAATPNLAVPDREVLRLLNGLANRPGTSVHIVSGRTRGTLERWLGELPIGLHAEHGFWSRIPPDISWQAAFTDSPTWKPIIRDLLDEFAAYTPGSLVEEKTAGLAWHYRMAEPEFGNVQVQALIERIRSGYSGLPIELLAGEKVLEIRHQGVNKGMVVDRLKGRFGDDPLFVAMGDDRTDEDLFSRLPPGGIAIHVGASTSRAPWRLPDVRAGRDFLWGLLEPGLRT